MQPQCLFIDRFRFFFSLLVKENFHFQISSLFFGGVQLERRVQQVAGGLSIGAGDGNARGQHQRAGIGRISVQGGDDGDLRQNRLIGAKLTERQTIVGMPLIGGQKYGLVSRRQGQLLIPTTCMAVGQLRIHEGIVGLLCQRLDQRGNGLTITAEVDQNLRSLLPIGHGKPKQAASQTKSILGPAPKFTGYKSRIFPRTILFTTAIPTKKGLSR